MTPLCRYCDLNWVPCEEPYTVIYLWGCYNCHAWREYFFCRKHYAEARYHGKLEGPWCEYCSGWSGEYTMKIFTDGKGWE